MSNQAKVILSAEDKSAAAFSTFTRGLDKVGVSASMLGVNVAGLLAGVSVGALATFAKGAIDAVDALNDVADATGASIENISALEGVAKRTGANFDTVSTALVKFNGVLASADPTKGPGAILKSLNLDIEALKRQDPAEALLKVAKATETLGSEQEKARVYQELFGRSTRDVAAFMKDLSEQRQLEATATAEQAKQAEQFNKEMFKLRAAADDAGRAVSIGLITEINDLIDRLNKGEGALQAFFGAAEAGSRRLHQGGIFGGPTLLQDLAQARSELKQLEEATFRLSEQDPRMVAARQRVAVLQAQAAAAGGGRGFVNPASVKPDAGGGGGGGGGGNGGAPSATVRDPSADAKRYLDNLKEQVDTTKSLTVYEKLISDLRAGRLGKVGAGLEAELKAAAQQVDAAKAVAEADRQRLENQKGMDALVADVDKKDRDRLDALIGAGSTALLEKQRNDMSFLAEAYEQGRLGAVGSEEAMRKFSEAAQAYLGTGGAVPQAMDEMATSALEAAKRIQASIGDELTNILQGNFDNIGDSFTKLLQRMAAEAASAQIMDALFGKINATTNVRSGAGLLGDLTASLGSLLSFDGGGHTGYGARSGGVDGKGGFLSILHPRERVLDETRGQGVGAAQPVTVNHYNFTVGDVATVSMVREAVRGSEARVSASAARSRNYGGALA